MEQQEYFTPYSRNVQEFNQRLKSRIDREQAASWQMPLEELSESHYFQFDQHEKLIETSSVHQEHFTQYRQQYEFFASLIPELDEKAKPLNPQRKKAVAGLIDYIYCLHGFYSFKDQVLAKLISFLSLK